MENTSINCANLPNLVIIGAMKSGTSSLHEYLNLHPQIQMSSPKELDFFIEQKNWQRGKEWYQSHFREPAEVRGESSPNYSKYPKFRGVPERMSRFIPNAKLIYVVRDPIERIVSHYLHNLSHGREKRSFADALANLEDNNYVNCSRYYMQVEQYFAYYSPASILILNSKDLAGETAKTMREVFSFVDVEPDFEHEKFSMAYHKSSEKKRKTALGSYVLPIGGLRSLFKPLPGLLQQPVEKPVVSESLHQALAEVLRDDVEKLRAFTGCSFANWSL